MFAEFLFCAMEARTHGRFGGVQNDARFGARALFDDAHDESKALIERQGVEGTGEGGCEARVMGLFGVHFGLELAREALARLSTSRRCAHVVLTVPHRDREEKRAECGATLEARDRARQGEEDIVDEIFGGFGFSDESPREAAELTAMAIVHLCERGVLTAREAHDEIEGIVLWLDRVHVRRDFWMIVGHRTQKNQFAESVPLPGVAHWGTLMDAKLPIR